MFNLYAALMPIDTDNWLFIINKALSILYYLSKIKEYGVIDLANPVGTSSCRNTPRNGIICKSKHCKQAKHPCMGTGYVKKASVGYQTAIQRMR